MINPIYDFPRETFQIGAEKTKPVMDKISIGLLSVGDICPNCGNPLPVLQQEQNGLLVCFVCRKVSNKSSASRSSAF